MVFNKTTNNDYILLNKQGSTYLTYSTEYVFENFEGEIARLLSPDCGISCKTCQFHLKQWFSNFHEPWRPSKDSQHLWLLAHQ